MNAFLLAFKPVRELALLGAISGVFSTFVNWGFVIGAATPLPGLFFGLVLAYGVWRWQTQSPLKLTGVVVLILAAWLVAFHVAFVLHKPVEEALGFSKAMAFGTVGLAGGFTGSMLTAAAIYLFAPAFRDRAYWKRLVIFGTIAGVLLAIPEPDSAFLQRWLPGTLGEWLVSIPGFGVSMLPMFVIWQAGVAAIVARGITGLK